MKFLVIIGATACLASSLVCFGDETKSINTNQLNKRIQKLFPARYGFSTSEAVQECIDVVEAKYLRSINKKNSSNKAPQFKIRYEEKFHGYGGHFFFEVDAETGRLDILSTAREESTYTFIEKGKAVRSTTVVVYAFAKPTGMSETKYGCRKTSDPVLEIVSEYPCGVDPSNPCPDRN